MTNEPHKRVTHRRPRPLSKKSKQLTNFIEKKKYNREREEKTNCVAGVSVNAAKKMGNGNTIGADEKLHRRFLEIRDALQCLHSIRTLWEQCHCPLHRCRRRRLWWRHWPPSFRSFFPSRISFHWLILSSMRTIAVYFHSLCTAHWVQRTHTHTADKHSSNSKSLFACNFHTIMLLGSLSVDDVYI